MWEDSKWFFVRGEPNGINDSGISDFKGTRFNGLAREIIQNSLDAKIKDSMEPVIVEFKKRNLPMDKYPNYKDFMENVDRCVNFIGDRKNDRGRNFYNNLIKEMNENIRNNSFSLLEISDYNTTGLDNVNDTTSGSWASLVRISGSNNKSEGAGGSFGIGKYAPFVFSSSRTIIYSTKNLNGNIAVQGKTILSGHMNKGKRGPIGYFGNIDKYTYKEDGLYYIEEDSFPFTNALNIPEEYLRTSFGTSLFILNVNFGDNWYREIINSVIFYFYKTIVDNKLIVRVVDDTKDSIQKIEISKDSINELMKSEGILDADKKAKITQHLKLLESNQALKFPKIFDLKEVGYNIPGEMELLIMTNEELDLKSLFFMRENGMVIKEPNLNNLLPYVAVMYTKNASMNEFLRECEGPKHDDWNGNNFRETELEHKNAKKVLARISVWVKNCLKESCGKTSNEPLEVFGMEECLPLEYDGSKDGNKSETISFKPIETPLILSKNKINQKTKSKNINQKYIEDTNGDELFESSNGDVNGGGSKKKKIHNGLKDDLKGSLDDNGEISIKRKIPISNIRVPYIQEKNVYKITFIPDESVERCKIQVRRVGADIFEELKCKKMYIVNEDSRMECNELNLIKNEKVTLEIELEKNIRGALEVNCYVKK